MGTVALKLSASANAAPVVGEAWATHLGLEAVAVSLPFTEDFEATSWADDFTELAQSPAPAFTAALDATPLSGSGANSLLVSFNNTLTAGDQYIQIVTGLSAQDVAAEAYIGLDSADVGVLLLVRASGTSAADLSCMGALLNFDLQGGVEVFTYENGVRTSRKTKAGSLVAPQNAERWRVTAVDAGSDVLLTCQQWNGSSWVTKTGATLSGSAFLGVSGSAGFGVRAGKTGVATMTLVDDLTIEAAS